MIGHNASFGQGKAFCSQGVDCLAHGAAGIDPLVYLISVGSAEVEKQPDMIGQYLPAWSGPCIDEGCISLACASRRKDEGTD